MGLWAHITDGAVDEIRSAEAAPDAEWVDCLGLSVSVGTLYAGGAFTPAPSQQAQAQLEAGLTITSMGTPALNGTYAVAQTDARINVLAQMISVANTGNFSNGAQTIAWFDTADPPVAHTFDISHFRAFAIALASFYTASHMVIVSGTGTLPSATVTIA